MSNKNVSCISKHFNFNCSTCSLRKASCLSLELTGHKTPNPLKLVFSDAWGHSPMFFFSDGFHYFIIFMDVYTKYIRFFPLVTKSMFLLFFNHFKFKLKDSFLLKLNLYKWTKVVSIKKLRIYFNTISIQHRLICPYNHEQNGTVECSHRHII